MALIAWSGLFVGTSLHGAVTAQAFAVPRVGLVPRHVKLAEYLQPWDIPEQRECVAPSHLAIAAERVMGVPAARREARREELVTAYEQTFERMAEALGFARSSDPAVVTADFRSAKSTQAPSQVPHAQPRSTV
jgi:polysaccharide pyruvyl transferase WcaK-like protein